MKIYENNVQSIGNTPLIRLNNIQGKYENNLFAKIEGRNPAYSVKCRIAAGIINDAIEAGKLNEGMTVIEATSGNTGIGLAYVGAALGYKVALIMPDTMSVERRMMMKAFGAELILTEGKKGMAGAVALADQMINDEPEKYFLANQFRNPSNPKIHVKTTGPEIYNDLDGKVDVFVAGVGTGGTITGVSRYLKNDKGLNLTSVAVEPLKSPIITQYMASKDLQPSPHGIQGIGAGFIPDILDVSIIDRIERVEDEDARSYARMLAEKEGIICGISSGAALKGALQAIESLELKGKNIVIILPDSGERYLSLGLYDS